MLSRVMFEIKKEWILVLLVIPAISWGSDTASESLDDANSTIKEWLDRVSNSSRSHSYEGTFIYRCSSQLVAMRIIHGVTQAGEQEKLISLSGPAQQISHNSKESLFSQTRQGMVSAKKESRSFPGQVLDYKDRLDNYYRLVLQGDDRVAGRLTEIVSILPKDQYRYGVTLWVDRETGLVLRSEMMGADGTVIEQMMFTDIQFLAEKEAMKLLNDAPDSGPSVIAKKKEELASQQHTQPQQNTWQVTQLPVGFTLVKHYIHNAAESYSAHEQIVFTDGLASVSVFIEARSTEDAPFKGSSRIGAMNAFGSVVNDFQVTVVGDVPVVTVELMGQSVQNLGVQNARE